jgi:hypothetical protein
MTAKKAETIGGLADAMYLLREEKRQLEAQADEKAKQIETIEQRLIELLDEQETTKGDGRHASVSLTESVLPTVVDWDAVWAYVLKTKNIQLLQNRVSPLAWRELCELKKPPPGIDAFTKRTIRLTTKR